MKKDWTYKKLGEVTTKICDGSHNPPHGVEYSKYPMLSSKNIFFDRYDYESPRYLSKEDFEIEDKRTNVSDGDVLLTIVGTVGRTCCVQAPYTPFTLQRSVAVLKPKMEMLTSRFLMYSLHSLSALWEAEAKGVAQKGVYLKQVANIQIPIPAIEEQQQIVAELDLLSGLIEKQRAQIEELDKLSQSIFYDMFGDPVTNEKGWEVKKMIEIYKFIDYRGKTPHKIESGVPLITARNIRKGEIDYSIAEFISEEEFAQRQTRGVAKKGDILFTTEAPMGFAAIADKEVFSTGQRLITFQAKNIDVINNQFALFYILSDVFQNELNRQATGSTVKGIKGSRLENFTIQIPPLSLQQEFAAKIEAIEAMKAKVRQSLKEAETLFNSRMDYYFN